MSYIHMDQAVVNALRDVMEGGFADLLDTFIADSDERVVALIGAQQAAALVAVAHSFKGSSSNMGAIRLAQLCGILEDRAKKSPLVGIDELVSKVTSEYKMVRRLYVQERERCPRPLVVSH